MSVIESLPARIDTSSDSRSSSTNRTRRAWIITLIVVHVAFGLAHAYQGWTGIIDEGLMGLLLGVIYLRTGRNLAVPIIAHGVCDSIDFVLMFLGKVSRYVGFVDRPMQTS